MGRIQNFINNLTSSGTEKDLYGLLKYEKDYETILDTIEGKIQRNKSDDKITSQDVLDDIFSAFGDEIRKNELEITNIKKHVEKDKTTYSAIVKLDREEVEVKFKGDPSSFAIKLQGKVDDPVSRRMYEAAYAIAGKNWDAVAKRGMIEFGKQLRSGITKENITTIELGLSYVMKRCYPTHHGISEKQMEALVNDIESARKDIHDGETIYLGTNKKSSKIDLSKDAYGFLKKEDNYENVLNFLHGRRQRARVGEDISKQDVLDDVLESFNSEFSEHGLTIKNITEHIDENELVSYSISATLKNEHIIVVFNGEPSNFATCFVDKVGEYSTNKMRAIADDMALKDYHMDAQKRIIELGKMIRDGIDKNLEQIDVNLALLKVNRVPEEFGITAKQLAALSNELNNAHERKNNEKLLSSTEYKKDRKQDTIDEFNNVFKGTISRNNIEKAEKLLNCVKSYDYKKYNISDKDIENAEKVVMDIRKEMKNEEIPSIDQIENNNTGNEERVVSDSINDVAHR